MLSWLLTVVAKSVLVRLLLAAHVHAEERALATLLLGGLAVGVEVCLVAILPAIGCIPIAVLVVCRPSNCLPRGPVFGPSEGGLSVLAFVGRLEGGEARVIGRFVRLRG